MNQGLHGEGDRCGKKASSRRRGSDFARAERYDYCSKRRSDNQKAKYRFQEMLNTIGDSLIDLASSEDEQDTLDWEDDERDTVLGKLSNHDELGWAKSLISKTVQHSMESFRQKQMRLDKLTQPGWGDAANYFCATDMKYRTAELKVPAVVKPQIDTTTATPSLTTFGECMHFVDIVPGQSQMSAVTSGPGSG